MILPDIGGRIHVGMDRTNGYDFFYRQNVIKPALVGLLGPWISGGVEFNWPQHHRPSTFMPVDWEIEERRRRQRHRVVQRARADAAHEGHARRHPAPGLVARRGPRPAVQSHAVRPDVPVVGQRRGPCPRPLPVVLPARRDLRRRPREARHVHVPGGARPLLRRRLRRRGRPTRPTSPGTATSRSPPRTWPWAARRDFFGGYDHAAERGLRPLGRPPHLARQEAVDLGQPRVRLRVGPRADRRRRAVRRADGRRLHRQPAGLQLPASRTRRGPSASAGTRSAAIGPAHEANRDAAVSLAVDGGTARGSAWR